MKDLITRLAALDETVVVESDGEWAKELKSALNQVRQWAGEAERHVADSAGARSVTDALADLTQAANVVEMKLRDKSNWE